MVEKKPPMKMPELLVFARFFSIGLVASEVFRAAFYLSANFAKESQEAALWAKLLGIAICLGICVAYLIQRDAHLTAVRMGQSFRFDLAGMILIGAWANSLLMPWLSEFHETLQAASAQSAPAVLALLSVLLLSPLVRQYRSGQPKQSSPLYFVADEEVKDAKEDLFATDTQAKSFADTVLASGAHPGLIFGVDGPWGIGKTSFINLAHRYWEQADDKVIVCRFEPLRYASEPDLADRLIRDLSAVIQTKVFAPEFRPAASRYSRLIKGKTDISFLGFKLSLEPSQETVDELLDDIDKVLRHIDRRVIIVIDDLDRLDAKTTNSVLFATRRTFKISQATFVLCYDTEVLVGGKDEGLRAREFLEKFVMIKLSLFVDSSSLRNFIRRDWEHAETQLASVPSDTMVKLGAVLNELAELLDGDLAANYLPLVGDLRKIKRFINAILLMQIEKTDLGRTDFNKRDLINLMLLHLNYPGLFRQIYAEETEGRIGTYSVRREYKDQQFKFINSEAFSKILKEQTAVPKFLLEQLFDTSALGLTTQNEVNEEILRSRACFNSQQLRNLESYLKLIVRFAKPELQDTFIHYQSAIEKFRKGLRIQELLESPDFALQRNEKAHDEFWRVLVNQSHEFNDALARDAIETLINYLPRYSAFDHNDRGLRQRSIYSLLRLLDNAGWGRTASSRLPNTNENVEEIAWRIFGEKKHQGQGLIKRLASPQRGVLGWSDLMIFRLMCSEDRRGQLYNLHRALIVNQNMNAETTGLVSKLALMGMRKLSQEVFATFKRTYIDSKRNFFVEANKVQADDFLGEAFAHLSEEASRIPEHDNSSIAYQIAIARSTLKSFVIYQLSNSLPPTGSGVGCGIYDEEGDNDKGGIAKTMNEYVFNFCFNPAIKESNVLLFLDHCLANLSNSFFSDMGEAKFVPSKAGIPGGLDPKGIGSFWKQHQQYIRGLNLHTTGRKVFTANYTALYCDDLQDVYAVLDELAGEGVSEEPLPAE